MKTLVFKEFYSVGDSEPFDIKRFEVYVTDELQEAIGAARDLLARNSRITFVDILLHANEYHYKETFNVPDDRRYILNLPEYVYLSVHPESIILKLYNDYSASESELREPESL